MATFRNFRCIPSFWKRWTLEKIVSLKSPAASPEWDRGCRFSQKTVGRCACFPKNMSQQSMTFLGAGLLHRPFFMAKVTQKQKQTHSSDCFTIKSVDFMDYPTWLCQQFAIENGPVEIVSFPMNSMVDLSIVMLYSLPEGNRFPFDSHGNPHGCHPLTSWARRPGFVPFVLGFGRRDLRPSNDGRNTMDHQELRTTLW